MLWIKFIITGELILGRVINPEPPGKERKRLAKSIVVALRMLSQQTEINNETRDMTAFIALALNAITKTIDKTVEPWEKRGYWVKADRFRMEWTWTEKLGKILHDSLAKEDWSTVAITTASISEKLSTVNVSQRHRLGTPWVGAWEKFTVGGSGDGKPRRSY